jgi:putative redox protein
VPNQRFQFQGSEGQQLAAALDLPESEPVAYALFAHCFTCGKDVLAARRIALALAAKGIAVLRFDFTGLGSSEGDFANSTFSSNVADLVRAADHLRETRKAPALLIGHSLGGAAILAAAAQIPDAKAVVTIAAPSDPAHVTGLFAEHIDDIRKRGEVEVSLAGRPFHIRKEFLDDIAEHNLMEHVTKLHKALLVMHAPTDDTVGIDNATKIFAGGGGPSPDPEA